MALLDYAKIAWRNGAPYSEAFQDIYYQPADGWAESTHTFIRGNQLHERFAAWRAPRAFVIGEIGFGSGLNIINAADTFLQHAPSTARLHCVSVEKHPWRLDDLKAVHRDWVLPQCRGALYAQYPHRHAGWHQIYLHPRITLTLILGDNQDVLPELQAQVDAWFLDGFAPSRNPDCWSQRLCHELSRCSHTHTTFATFSAARAVREALSAAGFSWQKVAGFAHKRDMLCGVCQAPQTSPAHWTDLAPRPPAERVAVIGSGIAGASTAHALANAGIAVSVFSDRQRHLPASDVPLAVPYLQPGRDDTPQRRYQLSAWHSAMRHYHQLAAQHPHVFSAYPIIRAASSDHERAKHRALIHQQLLDTHEWQCTNNDDLIFLRGGVINLPALCRALCEHPLISEKTLSVECITRADDAWLIDAQRYSHVILCTGWQTHLLPEATVRDAIRPLRGQGTLYHSSAVPTYIHCSSKTIIPDARHERIYCGASFCVNDTDLSHRAQDDADNLAFLCQHQPNIDATIDSSFVGVRGGTRDYLPLVGPIATSDSAKKQYAAWRYDARKNITQALTMHHNLFIHAGLGSKGCTNAFLNAELLSALISNAPLPIPRSLLAYLYPSRFILRRIIRNQD